jgi:hypothetical protein
MITSERGRLAEAAASSLDSCYTIGERRMIAYDQTFADAVVYLDGNSFYRCKFERCTIVINGLIGCTLADPQFIDCKWTVNGPAQNTLGLLSALYKAGAKDLVEATFAEIRGDKPAG